MKLLAVIFIVGAALFSQGDCYGYDYEDDYGVRGYQSDFFEPETRAMMLDEPKKKKMGGFTPLHFSSTTRPMAKISPLEVTERPRGTFKPWVRKTKTDKPLATARPVKMKYKKPPPPPKLKKRVEEEKKKDEEEGEE